MTPLEVKICGLTSEEDARAALDAGADYLGFVLYPPSPRGVDADTVAQIRARLPDETRCIGVFVNTPPDEVRAIVERCALYGAQIHGDEAFDRFVPVGRALWRALHCADGACRPDPDVWVADRYVLDAAPPGIYGGAGVTGDWEQAAQICGGRPCMLAGGLTAANVAEAIRATNPAGVDVSSGVESEPGRKDHAQVRAFVTAAREAGRREL